MSVKKFVTQAAAPEIPEGVEPIEFDLDGERFVALPPTQEQVLFLVAAQAEGRDMVTRAGAIIDFLANILRTDDEFERFKTRLLDPQDSLGFGQVEEIVEWLVEEWSGGRPTKPSSDSRSSRASTGTSSTAKRRSKASVSED